MAQLSYYKDEYIKCYQDKTRLRFIENFLSTFNADERKEVPFHPFPRQRVFLQSLVDNNNTVAIKHRQCGITTLSSAWITGQIVFANHKSPETVLCIGNKLDIAQQLVTKIRDFLLQVPRWMWGGDYYSPDPKSEKNRKDIFLLNNQNELKLFNGCRVVARSSGPNAARGISAVSILIFDEAAFIENGPTVYSQAVAATASVKDAKIIMVSTPNGKDSLYYKTYSQALAKKNNYNAVEFKWFQDLRYNRNLKWYRTKEDGEIEWIHEPVIGKRGEVEYNEEKWRELEKEGWIPTSPWYVDMCKTFNNDSQKIAQELDVSFLGSSDNAIPTEAIEMQRKQNVIELPDDWGLKDPYVKETWIWKQPIPGHRYVCAVDCSTGSSDDSTAIEMLDIDAIDEFGMPFIEQVLEYNGKRTSDEIGEMVFHYASAYNNAYVVVDCVGGYGDPVVLELMRMKYPNLYYDQSELKNYTANVVHSKLGLKSDDKLPGFRTSSVRVQMLGNFVAQVKDNGIRVRSVRVVNEMETWIWKSGRIDHMDGFHDDTLTCLAMGLFVTKFFIFKRENEVSMNKSMINSWLLSSNQIITSGQEKLRDKVNISKQKTSPFISTSQIEKKQKQRLKVMILLGGVKRY